MKKLAAVLPLVLAAVALGQDPKPVLERVARDAMPPFAADDLDRASLRKAIAENRRVLSGPDRVLSLGGERVTRKDLLATLDHFERLLDLPPQELAAAVASSLAVYRSVGSDGKGKVLFTGYHSPCYEGSRMRTERARWPLRRKPEELVRGEKDGRPVYGRMVEGSIVPHFTRREIEAEGKLDGRGLEVAWFVNRLDAYLMEVQGSGSVRLEDGSLLRLQFAASNGHPYVSLGKELVKDGKIPLEKASIPAIRAFFKEHPELEEEYLLRNPSYVFFNVTEEMPTGCTGARVTPGRSIATDKKLFCGGALAFIVVEMPICEKGQVVRWEKRARFVLDDDTGGAIRGPGRVDIYEGDDEDAAMAAGVMKREGELYYLLRRPE